MDSRWINFKKLMTCATSTFTTLLTGKNKNPTKVADRLGQDVFTIMKYPNSSNHSIQFFWIPYRPTSQSCLVSPWNQKKYCSIKDSVQLRLGLGFHTQSRRFRATGKFKNRCETRGANMFGYDWSILSVAVTCYTYLHIILQWILNNEQHVTMSLYDRSCGNHKTLGFWILDCDPKLYDRWVDFTETQSDPNMSRSKLCWQNHKCCV